MTQNESPRGAVTPTGAGEDNASPHHDDTTPMQLIQNLLVRMAVAEREIECLKSENKRLKSQQAQAYDWSMEVPREMREVG